METAMGKQADPRNSCEYAFEFSSHYYDDGAFPHPFYVRDGNPFDDHGPGDTSRTVVELRMCALSASIRNKSEWWKKKDDPAIRAKWREEALSQPADLRKEWKLTPPMVDYVLSELDGYARLRDESTGIEVACYERTWKSDALVPDALRDELLAVASKLEDVPDNEKDWHPNSEGKVLDLVHPSLYPVVYGKSLARDGPDAEPTIIPSPGEAPYQSGRFQWLPSDFAVSEDGVVKLVSPYINNLHPEQHQSTYRVLEKVVEKAVPMWERVLSDLRRPLSDLRMVTYSSNSRDFSFNQLDVQCVWGPDQERPYPEDDDEADDWDNEQWDEFYDNYPKELPEALPKYDGALDVIRVTESLKGKNLQIIVKLANIILTPDKPKYDGGKWHVEGMKNEHIVSTFIYYYDESNVTESRLAFRTAILQPLYHGQDDTTCTQILWDMDRESPCNQDLGTVVTKQGRCIAFPNIYQHQVQPFRLDDPSKPGHRKILALFLVDPTRPTLSATTVCPGQRDWYEQAATSTARMQKLPVELRDLVVEAGIDGTMSRKEAEDIRLELMQERSKKEDEGSFYKAEFDLCEH